ncbi:hypothetical protein AMIS_19760 [Actinoplanes missouriensis 431]|uniref:Uncharacterized protein n=1 Tax=Actinoplanes missouriensis (strain ATCC 14538 / DSM 43046 / CBS 188.64 / JCM 3121 / NBRC 102363 / NCIMB 12654 / NRRL B-3342 / UNCC 431) TaxID=512565 RepID=I0H2F9_ACTM4|nr:hypothetical protein [Actinoplanes missouriensis]BAL87196.1 hypothetical protein AMIS_19760 [Actinoplanes missouriensis 431]
MTRHFIARCVTESDGMHQHEYRIRDTRTDQAATITEHLHTWTAEHLERWPDAKPVDVATLGGQWGGYDLLGKYDTLAEAWAGHATGDIPDVACQVAS